jgi:hypothetical protein
LKSLWLALLLAAPLLAHSQSGCSSDGQARPGALFERFVNADCDACWRDAATPVAPAEALTLDWILPGSLGDDAPLASAASSDALARLETLQHAQPAGQARQTSPVTGWPQASLRLAHGPAVGNYVGVAVALNLPPDNSLAWPLSSWLLLTEALPAGTEGSPVARNLVRNVLQTSWNAPSQPPAQGALAVNDMRAMSLPEGSHASRLRVAGWVQDARGRVLISAQTSCPPEDKD